MKKTIVDYLEKTTQKFADKISFADDKNQATYAELTQHAQALGTALIKHTEKINKPIAIYLDKTVSCIEAMLGVVYSGNFYTILDTKSPAERIELILSTLETEIIITSKKNEEKAKKLLNNKIELIIYKDIVNTEIDKQLIDNVKGETFNFTEKTTFGSQTPFYFSMSITDVFSTIMTGATFYIIPKMYFSFPVKLVEFLNNKKVNTIYWVPSALCIVANMGTLDITELPYLTKVLFAGEVMPTKQLNMWIKKLPHAMFANLFGPTETTDICTYYVIDRKIENTESLPIGKHCDNCDVMVIKEDGTEARDGEEGELCVRGSFLAAGYYKNPEKTNQVFVQNPLNKAYPEVVYRTGDIVKYNEKGELIYISRKDFQIKHMGYRIELGEIENRINNIDGIMNCACIYDTENSKIVLFYQGNIDEVEILNKAKEKLTNYMVPNKVVKLDKLPYNANGKIDRKLLQNMNKENN